MVKLEVSDKIVSDQDKQTEQEEQGMLGTETPEQEQAGYQNLQLCYLAHVIEIYSNPTFIHV